MSEFDGPSPAETDIPVENEDLSENFFAGVVDNAAHQEVHQKNSENQEQSPELQKAVEVLKEHEFLQEIDGKYVANLQKFRKPKWSRFGPKLGAFTVKHGNNAIPVLKALSEQLGPMHSQQDIIQEGDRLKIKDDVEAKPLFYIPENAERALDVLALKSTDYHLGFWDTTGKIGEFYPTQDGSQVRVEEAATAAIIYSKDRGDGYRDSETGRLLVRGQKSRKYKPISGKFFIQEHGWRGGYNLGRHSLSNASNFIEHRAPGLASRDMVRPSDFPMNAANHDYEKKLLKNMEGFYSSGEELEWDLEKRAALFALKEHGYLDLVTSSTEGGGQIRSIVINKEKFLDKHHSWTKIRDKLGPLSRRTRRQLDVYLEVFSDLEVFSNEDVDLETGQLRPDVEAKPLLYIPESAEEALSIDSIQEAQFHFGSWEVARVIDELYPTEDDSAISSQEAIMALIMYHPEYGAGERNEKGQLIVTFGQQGPDKIPHGERRPTTSELFPSLGYIGKPGPPITSQSYERYLHIHTPRLLEKGLLLETDITSYSREKNPSELRTQKLITNSKGMVMHKRVKYTLGTKYGSRSHWFVELNDDFAAIVDAETGIAEKVFELQSELSTGPHDEKLVRIGDIKFYSHEDFSQHPELKPLVEDIDSDFYTASKELALNYKIRVANMPLEVQAMAAKAYKEYGIPGSPDGERFKQFLDKHGEAGFKAMLLLNESLEAGKVLDFNKLDGSVFLFNNAAKILELTTLEKQIAYSDKSYLTLREKETIRFLSNAARTMAGKMLVSVYDEGDFNVTKAHSVNNTLYRYSESLREEFDQLRIENDTPVSISVDSIIKPEVEDESKQLMSMVSSLNNLFEYLSRVPEYQDPAAVEQALLDTVVLVDSFPEIFSRVSLYALEEREVMYRLLAKSSLSEEQVGETLGRMLAVSNVGDELATLRQLANNAQIPDQERQTHNSYIRLIMQAMDNQTTPGVVGFYQGFDFSRFDSHAEYLEQSHDSIYELLNRYGISEKSRVRDIGSGYGELVDFLRKKSFDDVRGLDLTPEYVEDAKEIVGDYFDVGDLLHSPYADADVLILQNNVLAHFVGEHQKREALRALKKMLNPGGIIIFDMGNPDVDGKTKHIVNAGRGALRNLSVNEEIVEKTFISISSVEDKLNPGKLLTHTRDFPPEEDWEKLLSSTGFHKLEISDYNLDDKDPRLMFVFQA